MIRFAEFSDDTGYGAVNELNDFIENNSEISIIDVKYQVQMYAGESYTFILLQ